MPNSHCLQILPIINNFISPQLWVPRCRSSKLKQRLWIPRLATTPDPALFHIPLHICLLCPLENISRKLLGNVQFFPDHSLHFLPTTEPWLSSKDIASLTVFFNSCFYFNTITKQVSTLFSVHFVASCHFSDQSVHLRLKISALTTLLPPSGFYWTLSYSISFTEEAGS